VPQLVSGRGRWKKREKRQEHSGKLLKNAVIDKGRKAMRGRYSHPQNENEIVPNTMVNCNRKKRS